MGAIQQMAAAAGPYTVEMRTESFYLSSWHPARAGDPVPRVERGDVLVIPEGDLPALAAALEQARLWVIAQAPWHRPAVEPTGAGWTVHRERGMGWITGPWVGTVRVNNAAGDADDPRAQLDTEVTYADLGELLHAVREAGG
jgi:hypothetical protein